MNSGKIERIPRPDLLADFYKLTSERSVCPRRKSSWISTNYLIAIESPPFLTNIMCGCSISMLVYHCVIGRLDWRMNGFKKWGGGGCFTHFCINMCVSIIDSKNSFRLLKTYQYHLIPQQNSNTTNSDHGSTDKVLSTGQD